MPAKELIFDDHARQAIVGKFEAWLRAQPDPDGILFGRASPGGFFPEVSAGGSFPRTPNQVVAQIRAWTPWAQDLMERWIGPQGWSDS